MEGPRKTLAEPDCIARRPRIIARRRTRSVFDPAYRPLPPGGRACRRLPRAGRSLREAAEHQHGSRLAIVFSGSPLFTGGAGSGESNIRRWIIENDWLEAIIALPEQMFYNTGIGTYV